MANLIYRKNNQNKYMYKNLNKYIISKKINPKTETDIAFPTISAKIFALMNKNTSPTNLLNANIKKIEKFISVNKKDFKIIPNFFDRVTDFYTGVTYLPDWDGKFGRATFNIKKKTSMYYIFLNSLQYFNEIEDSRLFILQDQNGDIVCEIKDMYAVVERNGPNYNFYLYKNTDPLYVFLYFLLMNFYGLFYSSVFPIKVKKEEDAKMNNKREKFIAKLNEPLSNESIEGIVLDKQISLDDSLFFAEMIEPELLPINNVIKNICPSYKNKKLICKRLVFSVTGRIMNKKFNLINI